MLTDDLLFGSVGQAAFHSFGDDRIEFRQAPPSPRRNLALSAGLFGVDLVGKPRINPLVHLAGKRDRRHFDIRCCIGAFRLALAVVEKSLLQQQISDQPREYPS